MKPEFVPFYQMGRDVKSLSKYKKSLDKYEEIAKAITAGSTNPNEIIRTACRDALKPLESDRRRKRFFLEDHKVEIDAITATHVSNADEEAWRYYCLGIEDELAYSIEPDILDALFGAGEEGDEDEGDEDGEDEEGDDDEGDED